MSDILAEFERLTAERDEALAEVERLVFALQMCESSDRDGNLTDSIPANDPDWIFRDTEMMSGPEEAWREENHRLRRERNDARAEVERLTAERDEARAEVRRLIAERDQPESRPKGREVGRFGLDGHYLNAMEPTRPSDEDIWREAFMTMLPNYPWDKAPEQSDRVLAEYRKRWPR